MQRLGIIVASTRPGRRGRGIAEAIHARAVEHGAFDVEILDLAEIDLPFLDEPHEATEGIYVHEHTREWSRRVDALDAFVFVMPEYNHSYNAPLKNAIDYLNREWAHKPVGLVSYGGVSGGLRAVQALKPVLSSLRMTPVVDAVTVPMVRTMMNGETFEPTDIVATSAKVMLDELVRYATALAGLRSAA